MQNLSREPNCFIRPSPSKGTLSGVTRESRETMLLCEAAGYDVILMETVGVRAVGNDSTRYGRLLYACRIDLEAQKSTQGIKKGIMELADAIVVSAAKSRWRQPGTGESHSGGI